MARLGTVPAATIEKLFIEFTGQVSSAAALHGSFETADKLLVSMLPDARVAHIIDELRGPPARTMWHNLGNVNEEVLAAYLKHDYPQTIAVELGRIKPAHAADRKSTRLTSSH